MYLFSLLFGTHHDKILGTILSKGGSGMRKLLFAVTLFLCSIILALPVSAQNAADQIRGDATIAEDGSCAVTLTASVTLDEPSQDLTFPIPSDATDVTVNGAADSEEGVEGRNGNIVVLNRTLNVGSRTGSVNLTAGGFRYGEGT
jgi:hypothetical protein